MDDGGSGIAPQHLSQVFDPYFTTKENGSGLGLASVHSIIHRHGGHVAVSSTPGAGACFSFYLPALRQEAEATPPAMPSASGASCRKLLVLDDDEAVRSVMASILELLGHVAVVTASSASAFDAARASGEPFDAIFVDLTLPGDLGGAAVVERLRERDPRVRVVVTSGYSTDPVLANAKELRFAGTLQRPFTVAMVQQTLAGW